MYEASPPGVAVLHCGGAYDARLLVPVIPAGPAEARSAPHDA